MKKKVFLKKFISYFLSAILCSLNIYCASASNISYDETEVARYNDYPVLKNQLDFPASITGTGMVDYYYSDGFFAEDATENNNHLYTTSLHLAASAFSSVSKNDYAKSPNRVISFLQELDFLDVKANSEYYIKPTTTSIGVAGGYKYVEKDDFYLVAVGVRGGGYESEWVSNFTIGDSASGNATGFQSAANKVYDFTINDIITKNNLPKNKTKIWISGFSRGAAVGDLAGKMFTEQYGVKNVFGYFFETPQGAIPDGNSYPNLKNVVYDDDIIPFVAPDYMGFTRFGQTKILSNSTTDMTKFDQELAKINPSMTRDDDFKEAKINILNGALSSDLSPVIVESDLTQAEYLSRLFTKIQSWGVIPNRDYYANTVIEGVATYQDTLSVLIDIMNNSSNPDILTNVLGSMSGMDFIQSLTLLGMITSGPAKTSDSSRQGIYNQMWTNFKKNNGTAGLSDAQIASLQRVWFSLCRFLLDLIYYDSGGETGSGGGDAYILGTLSYNMDRITLDHYQEKTLAFLRLEDNYYQNSTAQISYIIDGKSDDNYKTQTSIIGENAVAAHTLDTTKYDGWFTDKECTKPYDYTKKIVEGDFVLYAKTLRKTPPTINADDKTVAYGTLLLDVVKDYTAVDSNGENVEITIRDDGGYNPEAAGTYKVTLRATDKSENETLKEVNITVLEKEGGDQEGGGQEGGDQEGDEEKYIQSIPIYILYNRSTQEHLLTRNKNEYDKLGKLGWVKENISFYAYDAQVEESSPIYRVYNPNVKGGDHHYTKSLKEANKLVGLGWKWDNKKKPIFYAKGDIVVYKLYNKSNGRHHYTKKKNENDKLIKLGWIGEGIAWYATTQDDKAKLL